MRKIRLTEQELIKLVTHVIREAEETNYRYPDGTKVSATNPNERWEYTPAEQSPSNNNVTPKPQASQEPNDSNSVIIQNNTKPIGMNFTSTQKKRMKDCDTTPMPPDKVWGIVIHYTGTDIRDPRINFDSVRRTHMNGRGYYDIAYHFLIDRDGTIHKGRDLNVENGGTRNKYWNDHTIAISYIGGCDSVEAPAVMGRKGKPELPGLDTRTPQQKASIVRLIKELKKNFPNIKDVRGHKQVPGSPTGCPGFDAHGEYQHLVGNEDPNNPLYAKI